MGGSVFGRLTIGGGAGQAREPMRSRGVGRRPILCIPQVHDHVRAIMRVHDVGQQYKRKLYHIWDHSGF